MPISLARASPSGDTSIPNDPASRLASGAFSGNGVNLTIEEWTDLARAVAACQERKTADYLTEHDLEDIAERYALEWDEATDGALPTLDDE